MGSVVDHGNRQEPLFRQWVVYLDWDWMYSIRKAVKKSKCSVKIPVLTQSRNPPGKFSSNEEERSWAAKSSRESNDEEGLSTSLVLRSPWFSSSGSWLPSSLDRHLEKLKAKAAGCSSKVYRIFLYLKTYFTASGFQGYKPQTRNPFWPYLGDRSAQTSLSKGIMFLTVTLLFWFFPDHSWTLAFHKLFKGLKRATPHGCNMWVVFGGKQIKTMLFSTQISEIRMLIWLRWPSRYSTTGNKTFLPFSCGTNWCTSQWQNASAVIHPFLVQKTSMPGGIFSLAIQGCDRSYGKITKGGRIQPEAEMVAKMETPVLAELFSERYTSLLPSSAKTFPFPGETKKKLSSQLNDLAGSVSRPSKPLSLWNQMSFN